ncbi:MAG: protein translocase subunit SecF [Thermosulfidibacteraceae bacterium]|jgi:preprotein translocase subunit SecF
MRIIKEGFYFDFIGKRKFFMTISLILTAISVFFMVYNKVTTGSVFNYGVDFTGGTVIQINLGEKADIGEVRKKLETTGIKGITVQSFGNDMDILVRIPEVGLQPKVIENRTLEVISKDYPSAKVVRLENVGPKVGSELRGKSLKAMVLSCIAILIYIGWRFQFKFGVGAIVALIHDVLVVCGIFAVFRLEFDLQIIAALLTIVGYSVNDTIIIYDRIRENLTKYDQNKIPIEKIMNISISETMNRTVITSLLVLIVAVSLLILGNEIIRGFALAFTVGTIVGTYSSIYIATPVALEIEKIARRYRK